MDLRSLMLREFDIESASTRSVIEITPDALMDYQADESLHSIRWNVSHLADIPSWANIILRENVFDVAPPDGPPHTTPEMATVADALQAFDKNIESAKEVIADFSLDTLEDEWSLLVGGQPVLTQPRYIIYRMYMVSHVAHHRAHLLVYLRTNGIETPHLYG
ncbi:DinB family protein [Aporhodopirellula aestuarii]|uniref:DinB family protein n=1 Tax=Aporhodopirellula aestuarii TaxID=2950107 RepID=A0ABT0U5M0_9BACT|nr:DinB family protein [Aporhodopirellula aestuarii]MCM2372198.1 DinB family protein [Aporhodopirellula aestuarii]